jgi:hypothetical protein
VMVFCAEPPSELTRCMRQSERLERVARDLGLRLPRGQLVVCWEVNVVRTATICQVNDPDHIETHVVRLTSCA